MLQTMFEEEKIRVVIKTLSKSFVSKIRGYTNTTKSDISIRQCNGFPEPLVDAVIHVLDLTRNATQVF